MRDVDNIPTGGGESVAGLDMTDIAKQDVNDPVWPSEPIERPVGAMHNPHAHESVRTVSGGLDLLHHVVEEVDEWIGRDTDAGEGHTVRRLHDKPKIIDTFERAAKTGRANTYDIGKNAANVGNGIRVVQYREDRARVVVTNFGPGICYLAFKTDATGTNPEPNMMQLTDPAVNALLARREIRVQGDVYAFPAVPGTSQIVDVQDEYGQPE